MIDLNRFECAIFDLDGTLIDSTGVWEQVDYDFLGRRGIPVPEDYIQEIKLHNFETGAVYTVNRFGLDEKPEDIAKEWFDMAIEQYANHIEMKPYAKEFLYELKEHDIKLALATSSDRSLYEPCLRRHEIYDLFDCFVQTSQVKRGKEFPDVYELAARQCETQVRRCMVFEDILGAVRGAKLGGFYTIAVEDAASAQNYEEIWKESDLFIHDYGSMMQNLIL